MRRIIPVIVLSLAFPLGCGSAPPPPDAPETPEAPESATSDMEAEPPDAVEPAPETPEEAPPPAKWSDMNMEQKKAHMMKVVMPTMGKVFKDFDEKKYGEFSCVTCHGPEAKDGKFEMPSPALPKLPAKGDFKALSKKHPKVMEFMSKQVVPEMAKTIDMEPYNPETQTGFGCYGCHQSK